MKEIEGGAREGEKRKRVREQGGWGEGKTI